MAGKVYKFDPIPEDVDFIQKEADRIDARKRKVGTYDPTSPTKPDLVAGDLVEVIKYEWEKPSRGNVFVSKVGGIPGDRWEVSKLSLKRVGKG